MKNTKIYSQIRTIFNYSGTLIVNNSIAPNDCAETIMENIFLTRLRLVSVFLLCDKIGLNLFKTNNNELILSCFPNNL